MAASLTSSILAKEITCCEICKNDINIRWKCIECDALMCDNCNTNIHPRFANADTHHIVGIGTFERSIRSLSILNDELNFYQIICKKHNPKVCCLFCYTCEGLVCTSCIVGEHAGHTFIEIDKIPEKKMEWLKKIIAIDGMREKRLQNIELKVARCLSTELDACHIIMPSYDDSLWILNNPGSGCFKIIQKVFIRDKTVEISLSNDKLVIFDIALMPNGNVLVADKTPVMKVINCETGHITSSQYSAGSLLITAVHITLDHRVVVGARTSQHPYPVEGRRVVIVMNMEGRQEDVWELDSNKKPIFACARPIASSNTGNVFILDYLSADLKGRLLVLSRNGDVLKTYDGHPEINTDNKPFLPTDVTRTQSDNFIVCDFRNNILHFLNSYGYLLSYIKTTSVGIKWPICMSFVDSKTLYVGCPILKGRSNKCTLYQVEFHEK